MIPRLTKAQFSAISSSDQPAIIVDAITDWRACQLWSPEYLMTVLKGKRVEVSLSSDGHFNYNIAQDIQNSTAYSLTKMAFEDAAKLIAYGSDSQYAYIAQQSMHQFPELAPDICIPEWFPPELIANMWFGRKSVTPLHHDLDENFFAQIYGKKEFTIFPPTDTANVYPFPITAVRSHMSQVTLDAPDVDKYPRLRQATPLRFTLNPGELLFLPAFWWHHVRSLDVSISLNFWWECALGDYVASPNSLRDLYFMYGVDRLRSTKEKMLTPQGLTFASAAALFLQSNHRWGAALLATAAFDEFLNKLRDQEGVRNTPGCSPSNLASDIKLSCKILSTRGKLLKEHTAIAAHIASMVHELSTGNEIDVSPQPTAWLVNAVQSLPTEARRD
jgi:hypothetical protein